MGKSPKDDALNRWKAGIEWARFLVQWATGSQHAETDELEELAATTNLAITRASTAMSDLISAADGEQLVLPLGRPGDDEEVEPEREQLVLPGTSEGEAVEVGLLSAAADEDEPWERRMWAWLEQQAEALPDEVLRLGCPCGYQGDMDSGEAGVMSCPRCGGTDVYAHDADACPGETCRGECAGVVPVEPPEDDGLAHCDDCGWSGPFGELIIDRPDDPDDGVRRCPSCMMLSVYWPEPTQSEDEDVRRCRVCGCTDEDCSRCIERTGEPCHWVELDLCSACCTDPRKLGTFGRGPGPVDDDAGEPTPAFEPATGDARIAELTEHVASCRADGVNPCDLCDYEDCDGCPALDDWVSAGDSDGHPSEPEPVPATAYYAPRSGRTIAIRDIGEGELFAAMFFEAGRWFRYHPAGLKSYPLRDDAQRQLDEHAAARGWRPTEFTQPEEVAHSEPEKSESSGDREQTVDVATPSPTYADRNGNLYKVVSHTTGFVGYKLPPQGRLQKVRKLQPRETYEEAEADLAEAAKRRGWEVHEPASQEEMADEVLRDACGQNLDSWQAAAIERFRSELERLGVADKITVGAEGGHLDIAGDGWRVERIPPRLAVPALHFLREASVAEARDALDVAATCPQELLVLLDHHDLTEIVAYEGGNSGFFGLRWGTRRVRVEKRVLLEALRTLDPGPDDGRRQRAWIEIERLDDDRQRTESEGAAAERDRPTNPQIAALTKPAEPESGSAPTIYADKSGNEYRVRETDGPGATRLFQPFKFAPGYDGNPTIPVRPAPGSKKCYGTRDLAQVELDSIAARKGWTPVKDQDAPRSPAKKRGSGWA